MPVHPVGTAVPPPAIAPAAPRRQPFATLLEPSGPAVRTACDQGPKVHPAVAALSAVDRAGARLDAVLEAARGGRTFTAAELIGLQAEAYRCAQTVDLASKLVEQGTQSVKQAINTQL